MRPKTVFLALCCVTLAATAWAGGGKECTYATQACLDHMANMGESGWLGIDGEMVENGYQVTKIHEGTPAVKAGIRKGDILTAINGSTKNDENFQQVYAEAMKPGNTVTFTYLRGGKEGEFKAKLAKMPEEVFVQMVGQHMLDHAKVETASREQ